MLRSRKSFTLLELMVAFIIMAILTAVAVPSLSNLVAGDQQTGDNASAIAVAAEASDLAFNSNASFAGPAGVAAINAQLGSLSSQLSGSVTEVNGDALFSFTNPTLYVCVSLPDAGATPQVVATDALCAGATTTTTSSTTSTTVPPADALEVAALLKRGIHLTAESQ